MSKRKLLETISERVVKRRKLKDETLGIALHAPENTDWSSWVSATKTKNYILNDPLCDWLENHFDKSTVKKYTSNHYKQNNKCDNFTDYILNQGHIFEENVVNLLKNKIGEDNVISIQAEQNFKSINKINETINAMNNGIPVIHSGLVHNNITNTFGIPDLIVRSDWINKIINIPPYSKEEEITHAPNLKSKSLTGFHYVIVDIKYTTLNLLSDKTHLSNAGAFPAYKGQLYIYNEAIANIQGYRPEKAFILGRKWKYTSNKEIFTNNDCFDRLGVINYKTRDEHVIRKTKKAIEWIKKVRTPDAKHWNITNYPLSIPELYPNMSNSYDYPWHSVKKRIAMRSKEITSLWMIGKKNRDICHSNGIYKWDDENLSAEKLGIKGKFTKNIIDSILNINKNSNTNIVNPNTIRDDTDNWQTKENIEFYIDFETVNDVISGIKNTCFSGGVSMIFMIGVGYIKPETKEWVFKSFVAKSLNKSSEKEICNDLSIYIRNTSRKFNTRNPKCIHWANAEQAHWANAEQAHFPFSKEWKSSEWKWFDLLKVFKREPITVKGSLNFSLKNIAKALKKENCIITDWDSNAQSCTDGKDAMIGALKAYNQQDKFTNINQIPIMKEIIKYNEVDTKVLYEIIDYLRNNHTD